MIETPIDREIWLDPSDLQPNAWNPNQMDDFMYQKAVASIRELGFSTPVVVRSRGDYYEIIDGEHRVKAAIELGLDSIPCWNLGDISDVKAKQLTVVLNETRGTADRERLGELLKDLLSSEASSELLEVLPYNRPDFEALLNVPNFDWDDIEDMTRPPESSVDRMRWVERIYRVSPEVAEVIDRAIAQVKSNEGDRDDGRALEFICAVYLAR